MDKRNLLNKIITGTWMMLTMVFVHAGSPLWTFAPLTATKVTVAANDTATVKYQITNQSKRSHTLVMRTMPGITQVTTAGNCPNPFVLGYQQSCILNLAINGSSLSQNVSGGPVVCLQNGPRQCYQPSSDDILKVTKGPAVDYTVGGSIFGLLGTLVLENNGRDALTIHADGTFTFSNALPSGNSYSATVQSQPETQTCTVTQGSGTITNANITNVTVNCSTNSRTVGGAVSGLAASESVVLQNNSGDNLTVSSNGSFTFSTPIAQGASYNVTVLTQPARQTCTVTNGSGMAGTSDITNVHVICATNAYTVGGTASGLFGTVVLQNNGMDNLPVNSNGAFTFPTPVAEGATYNVTVLTQPTAQTCTVTNDSGTMGGANVTNISVNCITHATTLSTSINDLALSVTGFREFGVSGTPFSGSARIITITNTGSNPAINLSVNPPIWPAGTTSPTSCGSTLGVGDSCVITVTPGNTATSNGTNPCSTGTAPVPGTIQVTTNNANTVSTNVIILSYGCIYQGGYIYAFDDTTPETGSVGGKVATTTNQALPHPQGLIWSSNGSGGQAVNVVYDPIYGISETSTPSSPNPSSGQVSGQTACNGITDGSCNTNNIYVYYQNNATNAPINLSYYAAGLCKQTINSYSDWYLPALCEMGYGQCGSIANPTMQNMQSNLVTFNGLNLLAGYYWSSTELEDSIDPDGFAWYQFFATSGSLQNKYGKFMLLGVRCSRILTF